MSTDTKRHQLSKTVDLVIPPPRVRMHVDRLAMNRKVESELEPIRTKLLALKKKGAPVVPAKPDSKAEAEVKEAYKAAVKDYNSFASDDYAHNLVIYDLCKKLTKIVALFDKRDELAADGKALSKKNQEELEKEQLAARDEPNPDDGEEVVTLGFTKYTKGVNLNNSTAVKALLQKLRDENNQVDLFFQRDTVSKTKIRFTDSSIIALATTLQTAISEFANHAMATTLEQNKKIMYPDHCVSVGLKENCSLYPLFCTLPSYMQIVDRQTRREQWEADFKEFKAKNAKKKASKPKKAKKATTKPVEKPEYQSFEQREVEEGHAYAEQKVDGKGNTKTTYLWKGIDDLEDVDTDEEEVEGGGRKFGFNFYIGQVCKNLKDINKKDDDEYEQVRVSTNIKRFFSNLLVELIHRIAPQIRLLMSYKDAKTVSYEMIITVLKIILIDSYSPTANGDVELTEEHQALFTDMKKKVKAYNDYHKNTKNHNEDDVEVEVEDDVEEDEVEEEEIEEEVAPEPVKPVARSGRNASRARK